MELGEYNGTSLEDLVYGTEHWPLGYSRRIDQGQMAPLWQSGAHQLRVYAFENPMSLSERARYPDREAICS